MEPQAGQPIAAVIALGVGGVAPLAADPSWV
jgi:hypothetical protein